MEIVLGPLLMVANLALDLYTICIIASAILSWLVAFNVLNTGNQLVYMIVQLLHRVTEPALRPIRRFIPNLGGIDISPIILLLAIFFVQGVLRNLSANL